MPYKTDFIKVTGKVRWFFPSTANEHGKWSHSMYLDEPSLAVVRNLQGEGIKNVIKKDDDGWYCAFSRPTQLRTKRGIAIPLAPPEVLDENGHPMDPRILVGKGSSITTKLEVYEHGTPGGGRAKAARWAATRIDSLVEYKPDRDLALTPIHEKQTRGLRPDPKEDW